ncbi:hypothetical protein HG530_004398 [Fusarium avenaceum]|nr:hypothetical protein HG530_004398 [Fusarium avenaceum]
MKHIITVNPDCTGLQTVRNADGGVEVLGVNSGSKAVSGVVSEVQNLLLVLELGNSADRAENLLLHDLHVGTDTLTTGLDGGTLVLTGLDVAHNTVVLELRDLRTLEGLLVEGVTNLVLLSSLLEGLEELVVDTLLDKDTSTSTAALSVVVVDTEVDPVDSLLNVGIVEDDVGGLATKLESDLLEVGRGSSLHDGSANDGRSSESDLVNVHVGGEGGTGSLAETGNQVEDTGRETSLLNELGENKSGKRSLLSSLHDKSVTTYGLGSGVVEHLGGNVNSLALDLVGPTTVVSEAANNGANIATGVGDRLSVVERLNSSEEVKVLLSNIGKLQEKVASALRGDL